MADDEVIRRIEQLVAEEHELRQRHPDGLGEDERTRMQHIDVQLDQCWDLLRQRRARRDAGLPPDDAQVRSESVVEGFQQ
jgi:hypothetical protein